MELRWKVAFLLSLALALGFIGYTLVVPGSGGKQAHLRGELERILEENRDLEAENRRLKLEVDALKRRRDYLEKVAREELGLVRKGEVVFHLFSDDQQGSSEERSLSAP